jgi:uncharacterized damage-inducible protein DinB
MNDTGQEFISRSRHHLIEDFLPKIERCLTRLTDEQIWWRPNEQSNSIGNLLLHVSGNARQWIVCGVGGATDSRDRDAEFAQRERIVGDDLHSLLKRTLADVDATLGQIDANQLLERRTIQGSDVSVLEAILHVVEHFSMHTGQIILLTKVLTSSDLHFYDFEGNTPTLRWSPDPLPSS